MCSSKLILKNPRAIGVGLRPKTPRVRLLSVPLIGSELGQLVRTNVPPSPRSIIWYHSRGIAAMSYIAGKVGVGLASLLAMRRRVQLFIHLLAQGLSKGDGHHTNTPMV